MIFEALLALIGAMFLIFMLGVVGSIFRTYSEAFFRRSRGLVFSVGGEATTHRPGPGPGGCPVLVAILLLLGIAVIGRIVGVAY